MNNNPLVYVVIPNKNGLNHLSYSLKSLMNSCYGNYKVVLVDNCSTDNSIEFVKTNFPDIKIIINEKDKGFAGSVNNGIKYAIKNDAKYIAIYSNDIKVLPGWINLAVELFNKMSNTGLFGYTAVPKEKEELFLCWGNVKTEYEEVKAVEGCLYICPAGIFQKIGYFDEGYYMYGEDNDMFCRIKRAGYKIIKTNVPVWHYSEGSSQKQLFYPTWLAYRNAIRYSIKNENIFGICRIFLSLMNQGCNPFRKKRSKDPVYKRMRRYNIPVTFLLIIGSIFWNLWHLPKTLKLRMNHELK